MTVVVSKKSIKNGVTRLQRTTGVIRPHTHKLLAFIRMADDLSVIFTLYLVLKILAIPFDLPYLFLGIGASVLLGFYSEVFEVYQTWRGSPFHREACRLLVAWLSAVVTMVALLFLAKEAETYSRLALVSWVGISALFLMILHGGWQWLARLLRERGRNTRNCVVLGGNHLGKRIEDAITTQPWLGLNFVGYYDDRPLERMVQGCRPRLGNLNCLFEDTKSGKVDYVYISLPMSAEKRIRQIVEELADSTVSVFYVPNFFVFNLIQARWFTMQGIPVVSVYDTPFHGTDAVLKRFEDVVLASLILVLVSVPMLLIALGVRLSSTGPVIFKQRRYGFNGEEIEVWKFRSMKVCEDGDKVEQAKKNDSRVTRFGTFLRRTSLDELPQFFNVLQGTMSIVGPRPHAVAHNEYYRKLIPGYMLRHKVKPGITGLAQVNGLRGETDTLDKMERRIRHDIEYIRHWSLWMDLKIIFLTVLKGFRGGY